MTTTKAAGINCASTTGMKAGTTTGTQARTSVLTVGTTGIPIMAGNTAGITVRTREPMTIGIPARTMIGMAATMISCGGLFARCRARGICQLQCAEEEDKT